MRPAFDALFAIDAALAEVVMSSTQPALGAIRLAWWREALERLDSAPAPAEPRLQAVARQLLPKGVTGRLLAEMEDGYAALLDDEIDADRVAAGGAALFRAAALLLDGDAPLLEKAGEIFAVATAARRGLMAIPADLDLRDLEGRRVPRRLRPLTALARLAARDVKHAPALEPEASPARAVALVSHKLFGTIA
nr:hypothetical protein [Sphingomonas jaspsi]